MRPFRKRSMLRQSGILSLSILALYTPFIVDRQLTIRGIDTGSGLPVVETPGYSSGNTIEITSAAQYINFEDFTVTSVTYGTGPTGVGVYMNPESSHNTLTRYLLHDFYQGIFLEACKL